jgi:hypothetical protein
MEGKKKSVETGLTGIHPANSHGYPVHSNILILLHRERIHHVLCNVKSRRRV